MRQEVGTERAAACAWGIGWIFQSSMIALQVIAFCHMTQLGSCWCEAQCDRRGSFLWGFCSETCFCYRSAWEPVSVEGLTCHTALKPSNLLQFFFNKIWCLYGCVMKYLMIWNLGLLGQSVLESFQEKKGLQLLCLTLCYFFPLPQLFDQITVVTAQNDLNYFCSLYACIITKAILGKWCWMIVVRKQPRSQY